MVTVPAVLVRVRRGLVFSLLPDNPHDHDRLRSPPFRNRFDDANAVAGGMTALSDGERVADADNPRGYLEWERIKQLPQ